MPIRPVTFVWHEAEIADGDGVLHKLMVMVPHERFRSRAAGQYEAGAEYTMIPVEARNRAFHNAYFAQINEAFKNLPEQVQARWDNVEHFRKWALVEEGFYTEKDFDFEGHLAERKARKLAAMIRTEDDYARIWVTAIQRDTDNVEQAMDAAEIAWDDAGAEEDNYTRQRLQKAVMAAVKVLNSNTEKWKVLIRRAQSQDHASMKNDAFRASAEAVLAFASNLIGTPRSELRRNAGRSA